MRHDDCSPPRDVIAIDGPAGAGKSTIARLVAARLGFLYVDTGAIYRAIALAALKAGLTAKDQEALGTLARRCVIDLQPDARAGVRVYLDGQDVTTEIREPAVDSVVADIASIRAVREALVARQRQLAQAGQVVVDGRDIGSTVLPDADHKFFVTADLSQRVERRLHQLLERGVKVGREEVERSIVERDRVDTERSTAPLYRAPDAVLVDTSALSVDEAVETILAASSVPGAAC